MMKDDKNSWVVMLRETCIVASVLVLTGCASSSLSPFSERRQVEPVASMPETSPSTPAQSAVTPKSVEPGRSTARSEPVVVREPVRSAPSAPQVPETFVVAPAPVVREISPPPSAPEPVVEAKPVPVAPAAANDDISPESMDHARHAVSLGDFSRAAQFYQKAAEAGNTTAMILLGDLYANGRGVRTDYNQAVKLYQSAQKAGDSAAAGRLAYMTIQGWGVPKSISKGVDMMQAAANKGDAFARGKLGTLILKGTVESQLWVCGPVAQPCVPERVIPLFQAGAKESDPESMYQLGELYRIGRGVPLDSQQAVRLFKIAADLGEPRGQHSLGMMYLNGSEGVPQEPEKGLIWLRSAASQGLAEAQNALGVIYVEGKVIPPNTKEAVNWYQRAAEQGNPVAQTNLASMYRYGRGVKRDLITAYKWYAIASQQFLTTNVGMRVASDISRRALEASMSPKDVERARIEANTWLEKYRAAEAPRLGS